MINDIDGLGKSHELSDEEFDKILEEARWPELRQKVPNTIAFLREAKASLAKRNQDKDFEIKLESADRELWVSVKFNGQGLPENEKLKRAAAAAKTLLEFLDEFGKIGKKYATKGQSGW